MMPTVCGSDVHTISGGWVSQTACALLKQNILHIHIRSNKLNGNSTGTNTMLVFKRDLAIIRPALDMKL